MSGIGIVGLSGIQTTFESRTIWHPTSSGPFEYCTNLVFRSPLYLDPQFMHLISRSRKQTKCKILKKCSTICFSGGFETAEAKEKHLATVKAGRQLCRMRQIPSTPNMVSFWNGTLAIPLQRGMVFTKIIIPWNCRLDRIFANFLFFFLSKNKFAFV